jgi:hypothetical protein
MVTQNSDHVQYCISAFDHTVRTGSVQYISIADKISAVISSFSSSPRHGQQSFIPRGRPGKK